MFMRAGLITLLLAGSAAAAAAQEHTAHGHGDAGHAHGAKVTLIEGLGRWSQRVTTAVPEAQRFFDQGLNLAYGFNHNEAVRSFEEALRQDPTCAMCAWGVAYALSPNINLPMSAEAETRARAAITEAQRLSGSVTERERAYIDALAVRFGQPAGQQRAQRDSAYAAAMRVVAGRYPDDADAQVLFADALLNLRPWNQWTREGKPQPGTLEVVAVLERVLAQEKNHAGACHFYIHTVEASPDPDRALPCAERLPKLMPGAGHIVHMPAHVYLRVGQYERAARANIAAVEADRGYFDRHEVEPGIYPLLYHPHNIHFLWAAYMMSGQQEKSLGAARAVAERVSIAMAREEASLQAFLTPPFLTHARFGNWEAVLAEPRPGDGLDYVLGMWHHARGAAFAAIGDVSNAAAELDSLRAVLTGIPEDMIIISNSARSVLRVAELVLEGRIEAAAGDIPRATSLLREAARLEDELTYDEPPPWYQPVRQLLGDVLLAADRFGEAEAAYRDDLRWVRENGWSLAGLERALRAQGKTAEADAVAERAQEAWKHADVSPFAAAPRVRFRSAVLPTGARIRFAESGDPAGAAVVLIHGYSDSWFSWSPIMQRLPSDMRVIALDLRGHGRSSDVPPDFGIDALASDVVALMNQLGVLRATVVGHSLGTLVAQALAAEHPDRVERLALLGAIPTGSLPLMDELREMVAALPDPVPASFIRDFQMSTLKRPVPDAFMDRVMIESSHLSAAVWRGVAEGWSGASYLDRLATLGLPTLLLWGDSDAMFSLADQQTITAALPAARLLTYEGTGHAIHWEQPDRVAADLTAFMRAGVVAQTGR